MTQLPGIRAISFDAGFTLLHPDPPVEEVYLREFARDGARGGTAEMGVALARTWKEIRDKQHVDRYDGPTGERGFWALFVERARHHFDGGRLSPESFDRLVGHFLEPGSWTLYPDVLPVLDLLAERGTPLAVVSNWDSSLGPLLDAHALTSRFSAVLVSAVEKSGKPHPEIFHRACRRLGLSPADVLHVGDSLEEDYEAARNAGLAAVLLDRGGRHPDVPERIASLSELPARLSAARVPAR
ncbi:MAG TPA: HAD-IA family hydrolase [Thermoanaerobaculia bacterium]|nr:HAD-IA family hydrolase [Thermoanaerobaculia bacterium]